MRSIRGGGGSDSFIQRALAVALQVEGHVVEAKRFEDFDEFGGHFRLERLREFFDSHFNADQIAMEASAELAESECLQRFFTILDCLDSFLGDFGAIGDAGTETGGGGTVPGGKASEATEFANFGFAEPGFDERSFDVVSLGGALAGTPVAEVVDIDPVDYVGDAAFFADFIEAAKQLVLAVEAPVLVVLDVVRVFEFKGFDVFVADGKPGGEFLGIAFVGSGDGGGIGSNGDGFVTESLDGGPGEISRVGPSGVGNNDFAHIFENREKGCFFAVEFKLVVLGDELDERGHTSDYTGSL